jgi:thiamine biosynthesis protein ThiS
MKIILNGEERVLEDSSTLAQLVDQLGMKPDRVAIERNRLIVARSEWPTTQLAEGDWLEIVHFVGGGSVN